MTVAQLQEALSKYPPNMSVFMAPRKTEYHYGLLNSISAETINMQEEPDGPVMAKERVIVLDEE